MGLSETGNYAQPTLSNWNPQIAIQDIIGGGQHTLILTKEGEVWVTGRAEEGTCGLGAEVRENQMEWKKIEFFGRNGLNVKRIAAGFSHNLALTEDDRVFSWGGNSVGQLGLGDEIDRYAYLCHSVMFDYRLLTPRCPLVCSYEPTEVEYFRGRLIKGVNCGSLHSLVWGEPQLL